MQIDITAKYSEYEAALQVLTPESVHAIENAARAIYGEYWDMSIRQYFHLSDGDYSDIGLNGEPTVAQKVWLDGLAKFSDEFNAALKAVVLPKTLLRRHEEQARTACLNINGKESMLVFVQHYFGLHNFRECEDITLAEYIIARRADFNSTVMQRRCEQLQAAELKTKQAKK